MNQSKDMDLQDEPTVVTTTPDLGFMRRDTDPRLKRIARPEELPAVSQLPLKGDPPRGTS